MAMSACHSFVFSSLGCRDGITMLRRYIVADALGKYLEHVSWLGGCTAYK
jgi:hypothetical protein